MSFSEHLTRPTFPAEGVALRVMKASDLPHIRTLHRNLLPVSYPAAFFIQLLVSPQRLCLVATDHGAIIGFASAGMGLLHPCRDIPAGRECSELPSDTPRSHVSLLTLGVLPAYQRRGIGRSLVHGVVQRLEASCTSAAQPNHSLSSDQIPNSKIAVLVQVQVAQSNAAGKCFYTHLGMMDQQGCDNLRPHVGLGSRTSVMAGVMCV
ncbi:hypothetical protein J3R82DRAFT_2596 [Butyriboletus roseoflavus]|nr:hypothetical protein J3R82DRAFT_2596 [Butyriboletus roseoflavus]